MTLYLSSIGTCVQDSLYYSLSILGFLETGGGCRVRVDTAGTSGMAVGGTPFGFGLVERSGHAGDTGRDGLEG